MDMRAFMATATNIAVTYDDLDPGRLPGTGFDATVCDDMVVLV